MPTYVAKIPSAMAELGVWLYVLSVDSSLMFRPASRFAALSTSPGSLRAASRPLNSIVAWAPLGFSISRNSVTFLTALGCIRPVSAASSSSVPPREAALHQKSFLFQKSPWAYCSLFNWYFLHPEVFETHPFVATPVGSGNPNWALTAQMSKVSQ